MAYDHRPMRLRLSSSLALVVVAACAKSGTDLAAHGGAPDGGGLHPGEGGVPLDDAGTLDLEAGPPYAVLGVQPSHGPFIGGTRIEIRGRGFSSRTHVRLGAIDVGASDIVASDPGHVQVITPAGEVGAADVTVDDAVTGTKAILPGGFTYDAYYADPNTGATTGGTHVSLIGRGTKWIVGTKATIDGKDCADLVVDDETHLHCTAPKGTPGTKSITVTTPDTVVDTVRDAYTYADTNDGYRGGLAGAALPGELKVLALANPDGILVPSATVVVRGADGTTQTQLTDDSGIAAFAAPPPAPLTVTITKKCLQPTTFDGVRVRSVTVYLNGVMSVACIPPDGTPPPVGGRSIDAGVVTGELVFGTGVEFRRGGWTGIPDLKSPTQRVAGYVFQAGRDNLGRFYLPDPTTAVTPTSPGTVGYQFTLPVYPGNVTVYAIAGIEDRPDPTKPGAGPATFEPYMFGIVRGVGVKPGGVIERVLVPMTGTFTHAVSVRVPTKVDGGAPTSARGPDRLHTTLSIDLGGANYMILPYGYREDLLPLGGDVPFVGVPPLSGALGSSSYTLAVEDVTGTVGSAPLSSILRYRSRNDSTPVTPGPYIPIPKLLSPAPDSSWDGRTVVIDLPSTIAPPGGGPPVTTADLLVLGIGSADGSTAWTIVAPGNVRTIALPDFSTHPELGLPGGSLTMGLQAARLDAGFKYDSLRYGQLGRGQWQAYAYDVMFGFW